ncbi:hypothetical protein [Nitrosomonas ureae]|uniref:Uncharacterized protein n=1 Tax=Nitrosomonas ureae TaxID=44577 RepID=A0A1H2DS81_9PROT|nr:hypothetical protein [Nitrosomonas ureae]ALQ50852.1 hypothetical protein ATY38_06175 [Nitrosomonas ureae]SDT85654.1 hypothetical protein SAMN05216406_10527 [Nitrosomonas ureae]
MSDEKDIMTQDKDEMTQPATKQIGIRMLPGEHTGQPLYSNCSTVNGGQGVVLVDFGFLDPQSLNALNRMARSGEKLPDVVNVKLSSRMAISIDTAHHLSQQLNQLLGTRLSAAVTHQGQKNTNEPSMQPGSNTLGEDGLDTQKNDKSGFRFPWSKKTH